MPKHLINYFSLLPNNNNKLFYSIDVKGDTSSLEKISLQISLKRNPSNFCYLFIEYEFWKYNR